MCNDSYFIEFRNYLPQKIELVEYSEDLAYTLLETAFGDSVRIVSQELQIYQVTRPAPASPKGEKSPMYKMYYKKAVDYSVEMLFKMVDNEPTGFSKREAFEVITMLLLPSWERM